MPKPIRWDAGHDKQGVAGPPYRLPGPCLPQAVSYDPADEANADLHCRMLTDPGRQPRRGEAIVAHAVAWCCAPYGFPNHRTGWRDITACVAFLTCEGEIVRLFGWDAVADWSRLVLSTDPGALAGGLDVHVRTACDPAGEHWWWVIEKAGE